MPASRVDERAWEGGGSCGLLRRSWLFPSAIQDSPIGLLACPVQPRRLSVAEEDLIAARMAALGADRTAAVDGVGSPPLVTR